MSKFLCHIENVLTYIALASAFLLVALTTGDAALRYCFNQPIRGAYEISEKYLLVISVFFALCYAYREGANIRVTFFVRIPLREVKLVFDYFVQIFSIFMVYR